MKRPVPSFSAAAFDAIPPPRRTPPSADDGEREVPRLGAVEAHERFDGLDGRGQFPATPGLADHGARVLALQPFAHARRTGRPSSSSKNEKMLTSPGPESTRS